MQQDRIFNAAVRRRYSLMLTVATFGSALGPFVIGLVLLELLWPERQDEMSGLLVACTLLLATLGPFVIQNRLGLGGNMRLRARLWDRVQTRLAESPEGIEPVFVGYSPGDDVMLYQGDTDQDIGFLAAWGDTLVYFGDAFSWHLPRERIDGIEVSEVAPGMERITVRWHAPREPGRAFTFVSREARNMRQARRATAALFGQLLAWIDLPASSVTQRAPVLGLPPSDASDGVAAEHMPAGSCVTAIALSVLVVLVIWQVVDPLIGAEKYHHAILWSGGIFVLGALVINTLLRALQWAERHDRADTR